MTKEEAVRIMLIYPGLIKYWEEEVDGYPSILRWAVTVAWDTKKARARLAEARRVYEDD